MTGHSKAGRDGGNAAPAGWLAALGVCAGAFLVMWAYHDLWRAKPYSLATANEAAALASVVGLAVALSLGPLGRLCGDGGGGREGLRRSLCVLAGLFALLHIGLTMTLLRGTYDGAYFADRPALIPLGALAAALLAALGAFRWPVRGGRWMGAAAYATLCAALLHFMVLGKAGRWLAWVRVHDHPAPPGTLPIFVVGLVPFVLLCVAVARRR